MENERIIGVSIVLLGNLVSSVSQVLLKISAKKEHESWIKSLINMRVIFAYFLFAITTLMNIAALRFIPVSLSAALESSGQIFVPIMSKIYLDENISKTRLMGMILIVSGIVIFSA